MEQAAPIAIRRRQDVCGWTFIVLFATSFVFQLLIVTHAITTDFGPYALVLALIAICGYAQLSTLASNTVSEIFAVSLLGFEIFFGVVRPYLVSLGIEDKELNQALLMFGAFFNFIALYLWGILFNNCGFVKRTLWWLLPLPLPYIVNFMAYIGYITIFADEASLSSEAVSQRFLPIVRLALACCLPVGYWKLTHSIYFAGRVVNISDRMNLNPLNVYTLVYWIIAIIAIFPYKILVR